MPSATSLVLSRQLATDECAEVFSASPSRRLELERRDTTRRLATEPSLASSWSPLALRRSQRSLPSQPRTNSQGRRAARASDGAVLDEGEEDASALAGAALCSAEAQVGEVPRPLDLCWSIVFVLDTSEHPSERTARRQSKVANALAFLLPPAPSPTVASGWDTPPTCSWTMTRRRRSPALSVKRCGASSLSSGLFTHSFLLQILQQPYHVGDTADHVFCHR